MLKVGNHRKRRSFLDKLILFSTLVNNAVKVNQLSMSSLDTNTMYKSNVVLVQCTSQMLSLYKIQFAANLITSYLWTFLSLIILILIYVQDLISF